MVYTPQMSEKKQPLSLLTWALIIGTGVTRGAYYMAFPFLAVHLRKQLGLDTMTIGWIIGAGPLLGALVGFYGAYLSDLFGRKSLSIITLIMMGIVQMGFSWADNVTMFFILSSLNGIIKAINEPIIQAIISDNTEGEARTRAYHYRYYAINIGVGLGPTLGAWALLHNPQIGFSIAGLSLILFAITFALLTKKWDEKSILKEKPPGFPQVMKTLYRDKALRCYVTASILCAIGYAQLDSTLPLILEGLMGDEGILLFGWMISSNAITIVIFQLIINRLTKKMNTVKTVAFSCLIFGIGFVGFGFSGTNYWFYILSMITLSFGEILVFSNGFILIDRLAPKNIKATYHSASNLFSIGFAMGFPLGAWLLQHFGQTTLFLIMAMLMPVCSLLYLQGGKYPATQD